VVLTDPFGEPQTSWETLINPGTPISPWGTEIHDLSDADVMPAPSFGEVAHYLIESLRNRVFVAHNVAFDRRIAK